MTCGGGKHSDSAGTLATVNVQAATESVTNLALLPGFLDPVNLLNSFGTWVLVGLLLVVFIESGLLFPLLPGDSLLFTARADRGVQVHRDRTVRATVGAPGDDSDRRDSG